MPHRVALVFLAAAGPAMLACLLVPGRASGAAFAVLAAAFPVALVALGAARGGRLGRLGPLLLGVLVLLEGCVVGLLVLAGRAVEAPSIGGLPLALVLQLGGLFLAPLPLVALAYALTFEREP
jgi:hypothetical protein